MSDKTSEDITKRQFFKLLGAGSVVTALGLSGVGNLLRLGAQAEADKKPNTWDNVFNSISSDPILSKVSSISVYYGTGGFMQIFKDVNGYNVSSIPHQSTLKPPSPITNMDRETYPTLSDVLQKKALFLLLPHQQDDVKMQLSINTADIGMSLNTEKIVEEIRPQIEDSPYRENLLMTGTIPTSAFIDISMNGRGQGLEIIKYDGVSISINPFSSTGHNTDGELTANLSITDKTTGALQNVTENVTSSTLRQNLTSIKEKVGSVLQKFSSQAGITLQLNTSSPNH